MGTSAAPEAQARGMMVVEFSAQRQPQSIMLMAGDSAKGAGTKERQRPGRIGSWIQLQDWVEAASCTMRCGAQFAAKAKFKTPGSGLACSSRCKLSLMGLTPQGYGFDWEDRRIDLMNHVLNFKRNLSWAPAV